MPGFLDRVFSKMGSEPAESRDEEEGYVELDSDAQEKKSKITVRPFVLKDFEDIKPILDSLREGYTIALINIKPLKDKDLIELKRSINKLKKTTDAIEGEIAGFGEDYIVVCPSFAQIYKSAGQTKTIEQEAEPASAPAPRSEEPEPMPEEPEDKLETY